MFCKLSILPTFDFVGNNCVMLAPDLNKGDLRLKSVPCNLSEEVRNVIKYLFSGTR